MYDYRFHCCVRLSAGYGMADFKLALVFFLVLSQSAYAGYAQLRPPPGWSAGTGAASAGQAGTFSYGAAANGASYVGGTVVTNAALNVAGQVVTMPVSMRLAANAAAVAAEYSFGNPYLFVGALVLPIAYEWFKDSGFQVVDGAWKKSTDGVCTAAPCAQFKVGAGEQYESVWDGTAMGAARDYAAKNGYTPNGWPTSGFPKVTYRALSCGTDACSFERLEETYMQPSRATTVSRYLSRRATDPQAPQWTPVTLPEFRDAMAPKVVPPGLPESLPGVGWPTEPPVFNPDPAVSPQPSPSPAATPRPLIIPTGLPVPTPDPAVWNQPGVRVSPAPAPDAPWRVDVAPVDVPQPDGTPRTGAQLNPSTPPATTPKPDTPPGLCDLYPDILACVKLDDGTDTQLDTKDKQISITPDSGWGSGGGSCPAPRRLSHGAEFSFQPLCDFATGVSPVLVAVAWVSAALLLLGAKGGTE